MHAMHPGELERLFARFEARVVTETLASFGGLDEAVRTYCKVTPSSEEVLSAIVEAAARSGVPVRTRGHGHAANGSAIPLEHELVIATEQLVDVRFEKPGTVTVGSGKVLWNLRAELEELGFTLPVVNDGWGGPSVGGFVAAGGFGMNSYVHGGFWNNVLSLNVADGLGKIHKIERDQPLFSWFFGAMGQLGIVSSATLRIERLQADSAPEYPAHLAARWPNAASEPVAADRHLFWFSLFVPPPQWQAASKALTELERRYADELQFRPRYRYPILEQGAAPRLVYPTPGSFTAVGSWLTLPTLSARAAARLRAFQLDIVHLARMGGYTRYIQTELASGPQTYADHFGEDLYAALRRLKLEQDPHCIFNRGSVFEYPTSS